MKKITLRFTYPTALTVAVTFLCFTALSSPAPSRAAQPEQALAAHHTTSRVDRVETRIKELHAKLKITPAQEDLWNNVTQVMRDNAKTMEALIRARADETSTMTAVDDLKSYGEIAEAHADGLKKFVPVFEPLYADMSDAQKRDADKLFHHRGHMKSKAKSKLSQLPHRQDSKPSCMTEDHS
jgi:periplasmic protein CpxP/Spy